MMKRAARNMPTFRQVISVLEHFVGDNAQTIDSGRLQRNANYTETGA